MAEYRAAIVGANILYATEIPQGSHLIRVGHDFTYDRLIVVTERDHGRELFLQGWVGEPLTLGQWRSAAASLFPAAEIVTWERRRQDGRVRVVTMPITSRAGRRRLAAAQPRTAS